MDRAFLDNDAFLEFISLFVIQSILVDLGSSRPTLQADILEIGDYCVDASSSFQKLFHEVFTSKWRLLHLSFFQAFDCDIDAKARLFHRP